MRHFVIVGILVLVMAVLTYAGIDSLGLASHMNPVVASEQALSIDWLWNWDVIAMSFLLSLIIVPLLYSLVVFRRKPGDTKDGEHIEGNTSLEITWTVLPLIVVLVFAYMGSYSLGVVRAADPNAMEIKVTGSQWSWKFEYPDYGITTKELYLPLNKQIILKMQSNDVIHSFWVPEFRVKQDLVPGRVTEYRITPILEGSYQVRCAELCGTSHAYMESPVIVVSKTKFDAWVAARQSEAAAAQTPEGRGQILVGNNGCAACHSLDGTKLTGPTWLGLFNSSIELSDGSTLKADEAYLTESIKDPKAKIVKGYPPVMPVYPLSDAEISDIVAFIKTVK